MEQSTGAALLSSVPEFQIKKQSLVSRTNAQGTARSTSDSALPNSAVERAVPCTLGLKSIPYPTAQANAHGTAGSTLEPKIH